MYSINDVVLHASSGVCQIDDIREERFSGKPRTYYVMHPLCEDCKLIIYVPVDSEKCPLRDLHSREEILKLIRDSVQMEIDWPDNNNMRKNNFTEILKSDNTSKIIALIECLLQRKVEVEKLGRKFPVIDEKILTDAEKRISQEFSVALKMNGEEVGPFILREKTLA